MVASAQELAGRLADLYAAGHDVDYVRFIDSCRASLDNDEALAELIDADGRQRLARHFPVDLARYLKAIPDLAKRPVALDAAIEFTLRSMSVEAGGGSSGATIDAGEVERLVTAYPAFETAIRASSILSGALWSTARVQADAGLVSLELPRDFGPRLPTGAARYELRELLGSGAHGAVYLAADRLLSDHGRPAWVAIKLLRRPQIEDGRRARLAAEATRARRINHPNVVRVLDRGDSDEGDYIVYEYVDGANLRAWLDARPDSVPPRTAAALVGRLARGLQAAHTVGVIHCDIKPDNIVVTREGEPKLADFGLAMRLEDGSDVPRPSRSGPIGNLAFIAPEQYRLEDGAFAGPADIYALGGVLYYLLTRELPNGRSVEDAERNLSARTALAAPPRVRDRRPDVDPDLEAISQRALARRPADRYASAESLAADLDAWARSEPLHWTNPSRWRQLRLFAKRQPLAITLVALLVLAVGIGSGYGVYVRQKRLQDGIAAEQKLLEEKVAGERKLMQERVAAALKLNEETIAWRERHKQGFNALMKAWGASGSNAIGENWLTTLTVLESVTGPQIISSSGDWSRIWAERIERVRGFVDEASRNGGENDAETLLWQTTLGFWTLKQRDAVEAERILTANRAAWAEKLDADDRWLAGIDHMMLCARIRRLLDPVAAIDAIERKRDLAATAEPLRVAEAQYTGRREGNALHRLILETLVDAYGSEWLDDRPARARAESKLRDISK